MTGYPMNFNQDFTSISVRNQSGSGGFRLFSVASQQKVDEIFCKEDENVRIVERLFNSSLVVLVTVEKPNCLKMLHFKKKQDICNCVYPSDILCVRMNRHHLVVCLAESIHIHGTRDMKVLHSITNIAPNELGLCTLSLNSYLAFPICNNSGELRIFNINKLDAPGLTLRAHDTPLSAVSFSPNGQLLATTSERGTVIRVFCVSTGEKLQEFRRGVKRCVRIASLVFSAPCGQYLCASSNTETVHIFKVDAAKTASSAPATKEALAVKAATASNKKKEPTTAASNSTTATTTCPSGSKKSESETENSSTVVEAPSVSWSGYLSKAVSSYLLPAQIGDVLSQDRAFATAQLPQPGLKHTCALAQIQKELLLLIACEDGFLYMYDFDKERGGLCRLLQVHDLRNALEGVTELNLTESMDKLSLPESDAASDANTVIAKVSNSQEQASTTAKPANSVLIEHPVPAPDRSYAGILRGQDPAANCLTESAKMRKLCDAMETPTKLFDERQFPPVAIAAKD